MSTSEVHQHVDDGCRQDQDLEHCVVLLTERGGKSIAHSAVGEHGLGQHCSREEPADLETDGRDHRQHGIAQHVPTADDPGGEALGLGGADVVLVEHVEHRGPGDPEDHREGDRGQGDRRQDQVLECVPRGIPLTGEDAVEDEHARHPGGVETGGLATRDRQHLPLDGEEVLEEERGEEHRHRYAHQGEDHCARVGEGTHAARGDVAERDPERDGDEQRQQRRARPSPAAWTRRRRARPRRAAPWWRSPKFPWTARSMNFRYCTGSGWSSPSAASRAALRSAVCRSPRIAETGPPGSERSQTKTSIDSAMTTRIIWSSRRQDKTKHASPPTPARLGGRRSRRPPGLVQVGQRRVGVTPLRP